jgi:hypothetical protein
MSKKKSPVWARKMVLPQQNYFGKYIVEEMSKKKKSRFGPGKWFWLSKIILANI